MAVVVYFVRDLLFSSKIRETAAQIGVSVEGFRDPGSLVVAAREARVVVLDLRLPAAFDALDGLANDPATGNALTVGFIDHEKVDVMDEASRRGCKKVLAKGRFAAELPMLLASITE